MSLKTFQRVLLVMVALLSHAGALSAQQLQRTRSPHGNIEIACQNCHALEAWRPIRAVPEFDHNRQTHYPLHGQHEKVACMTCHVDPVFKETGKTCSSCHADIHRRQFGASCDGCHTVQGWRIQVDAVRRHVNRFPLAGAHGAVTCETCHRGAASGTFTGLSTACVSCHASDYAASKTVDHKTAGFGANCESCHTINQWRNARVGSAFDHSRTPFPLAGAHASVACSTCHTQGRFAGIGTTCVSCHLAAFNATTNPNHVAASFSQNCQTCHTPVKWQGAAVDHSRTKFPLTGAHNAVQCSTCHAGNKFAGTATTCYGCHASAFNATTTPNHLTAGFPQDCTFCHSTSVWRPASFDHSKTSFPLMGAHVSTTCASCHTAGRYTGTPMTCVSCHLSAFNATTSPNHTAAGFPQDCQLCHTPARWLGATFDHKLTRFPLTGAHISVKCASCHVGSVFTGTPTACHSCHATVFKNVTNPNHVAAGFPTTCETCHTTTAWTGAVFTHKFPIYSGAHAGKWSTCNDCHTNPSNYAVFSCITCHTHNRTSMDDKHRGRTGYVYDSLTCYSCHPNGTH